MDRLFFKNLSYQEKEILKNLYWREDITQKELKGLLDIKSTSFYYTLDALKKKGLIAEKDGAEKTVGRPTIKISLNSEFCYNVCVLITRSHYYFYLVDFKAKIIRSEEYPISFVSNSKLFREQAEKFVSDIKREEKYCDKLFYCIVISGYQVVNDSVKENPFISELFAEQPLDSLFSEITGLPVVFDSIPKSAALGIFMKKHKDSSSSLIYLGLSKGIGIGIINNKKPLNFRNGYDPRLGLWTYPPQGKIIDSLGSERLVEKAKHKISIGISSSLAAIDDFDIGDVLNAASSGDRLSLDILEEGAGILAVTIRNLQYLFNSEVVVIGGQLVDKNDVFYELLQEKMCVIMLECRLEIERNHKEKTAEGACYEVFMKALGA